MSTSNDECNETARTPQSTETPAEQMGWRAGVAENIVLTIFSLAGLIGGGIVLWWMLSYAMECLARAAYSLP